MFLLISLVSIAIVDAVPPISEAEAIFKPDGLRNGISGSIIFTERYDGQANVHIDMEGLATGINWRVNKNPCLSFNNAVFRSNELLVSEIGAAIDVNHKNISIVATTFGLRKTQGIVGRSISFFNSADSVGVCANILWREKLVQFITEVNQNGVYGNLVLWEPETGSKYPWIIFVEFRYGNKTHTDTRISTTTGHDWHIHVKTCNGNNVCACLDAGKIIGTLFSNLCSIDKPEECADGCMNCKHGKLSVPGEFVFLDYKLYRPQGESFVLHQPMASSSRLACNFVNHVSSYTKQSSVGGGENLNSPTTKTPNQAGIIAGAVIGSLFGLVLCCCCIYLITHNSNCLKEENPLPAEPKTDGQTELGPLKQAQYGETTSVQAPVSTAVLEGGKWRAIS